MAYEGLDDEIINNLIEVTKELTYATTDLRKIVAEQARMISRLHKRIEALEKNKKK